MVLFIILGAVVLITFLVLGTLFYMLAKEGKRKEDEKAVPVTDLGKLKKELSSGLLEPLKPKADATDDSEIIPAFVPKVSLPTQEVVYSLEEDDAYKKRAQELENELRTISQKAEDQSIEAKQMIEILTEENESLKRQQANLEQAQQKLNQLQGEAAILQTENSSLQSQLDSTNSQVRLLEEQMTAVRIQMGDEISRANATVSELTREKEALLSAPKSEADQGLHQELESLRSEQVELKQKYEDLDRTCQKVRELNTHLIEKNDLLQYELIKARAQSSGLERVSFNYKNQLEDFLKKVNLAEGTVSQVKSRLVNLERENEDLKALVQQKNQ